MKEEFIQFYLQRCQQDLYDCIEDYVSINAEDGQFDDMYQYLVDNIKGQVYWQDN